MKLFVTGATGFIGSHFVNLAHKVGYEIIGLRRKGSLPRVAIDKQPLWIEGPLDGNFFNYLNGCDVLVHFASHSANPPYDSLENCLYWNLTATLKLCNQAADAGVKKFLIAGSCFEYGRSGERYDFIPTNAPLEPTSTYPASKACSSVALYGWAAEKKIELKILRIFQVFGEGELESRLWPSLRRAALSGLDFPMTKGDQVRDFINVEKVVEKFIDHLNFNNINKGEPKILHIGSGNPQSVLEFSQYWWDKWGGKGRLLIEDIPYRDNEVMRYVPMVEKNDNI
jgi:nucleoside-diphosphate-sugar epimerase